MAGEGLSFSPDRGFMSIVHDKVAVVDFGGQYAHLIAAKVRRQHVLAEILQPEDPIESSVEIGGFL